VVRELELARADGKPVIVSMSSVAASGGYWIATAADEVWAAPTTITGSIGIYGMFPTFQGTLGRLGIKADGVGTTPYADALRLDRPVSPALRRIIQASIDEGYRRFLGRVAAARGKAVEEVDEIARGRVWTGARAHELGLVDHLGSFDQAVAAAVTRAGLEDYELRWSERQLSFTDRMLVDLFGDAELGWVRGLGPRYAEIAVLELLATELTRLARFNDPAGSYAYCFCDLR
jgi:protease-4